MVVRCFVCQGENIEEVVKNGRRYFYCSQCDKLYERAYDRLLNSKFSGEKKHITVGGLIHNQDRILMMKRRVFPFGFDFPAGHLEHGETPTQTLEREILEETGLRISNPLLIYQGDVPGSKCRYGVDEHYWYFFSCDCLDNTPFLNHEGESAGWFQVDEIRHLDLIPSAQHLFKYVVLNYA